MKKAAPRQLGVRIRFLRQEQSLTQEKLASLSGISLKYIQNLEGKNPQNPSLEVLQRLAGGFSLPLWKLLKFEE